LYLNGDGKTVTQVKWKHKIWFGCVASSGGETGMTYRCSRCYPYMRQFFTPGMICSYWNLKKPLALTLLMCASEVVLF
jgi:hypothetical protein